MGDIMIKKAYCFAVLLLIGCAGTQPAPEPTPKQVHSDSGLTLQLGSADDSMTCRYEKKLGSGMKQKVCSTERQRAENREASRAQMERLNPGTPDTGN